MTGNTLVLLGDSILDNASYTRPEPDTAEHLRRLLGTSWRIELLARDGSTIADEPSADGAAKIARAIAHLLLGHPELGYARVFAA